jgi:membrane protein implicated in regulation of membrane protease activity
MTLFQPDKPKMLPEPVHAIIETVHHHTLRVKYAGTTWPAKLHDSNCEVTLVPGQPVAIVGIQSSIILLISV